MADTLTTLSIILFIAAGGFAVLAAVLWFVFKIPVVIGDLSGSTARKSIEQMRRNNEKTGDKSHKSSAMNLERGKLTSTMETELLVEETENGETGLLMENMAQGQNVQETGLLLSDDELPAAGDVAVSNSSETNADKIRTPSSVSIKMLGEIVYLHTDEVI